MVRLLHAAITYNTQEKSTLINVNPVATQQVALDNSLVALEKRLKIEKCNARITFSKPQREETYQVTLDALKLSPCYPAFLLTAEVMEIYMHQFWNTIKKIRDLDAYNFRLEKKKCPGDTKRTFNAIINRCISGKTTGLDRLGESRARILWGMYNKKNVDYIALLWEDFMYQVNNREISSVKKEHILYPRFTKVIISHFISMDKTISMRNKINLHTIRDDSLLGTLKFVSKTQDYQQYGALIPYDMIIQDIKDSKAYKTYYDFATRKATPKKARKYKKVASPSRKLSPLLEEEPVKRPKKAKKPAKKSTTVPTTGIVIKDTTGVSVLKNKAPTKVDRGKGMDLLSDVALLKAAQVKEALKKSKKDSHKLHPSGSGDEISSQPKVLDESEDKTTGTDEGTGTKPGVLDVPKYQFECENKSWGDSKDDNNDDNIDDVSKVDDDKANIDDDDKDAQDSKRTDSDEEKNPNLNLKEFDDDEYDELYKDVDVRSKVEEHKEVRKGDAEMTDATHEIIDEVASMMNVKVLHEESSTQAPLILSVAVTTILECSIVLATTVPSSIQPFTPISQQSTPNPAPTTALTTTSVLTLLDFSSLFGFDQRVFTLEKELAQFKQANHSAQILASIKSQIPAIVDEHLTTRIRFATQTALQSYMAEFKKKAQEEKDRYIDIIEKIIKDIIKDEVKSQLPQILPKKVSDFATPVIQNATNKSLKNVILAKSSSQSKSTNEAASSLTEFELKKIF
nr:hypothetical protein [Tanacetum cinerariifolium]